MKELTIEEKAKAYNKVREKIAIRFGSNVADEIFSEYEDNKDEKIRKALIRFHRSTIDIDGIKGEDIIAWLEKQVEQKPVVFKAKDWYVSKVDGKIHNMMYNPADKKELKKIDNEIEIPFGAKDSELQEVTYYIPQGFHAEIDNNKVVIKKGEKPTAWSEEDEKILNDIDVTLFEEKSTPNVKYWKFMNWLKSIKERLSS